MKMKFIYSLFALLLFTQWSSASNSSDRLEYTLTLDPQALCATANSNLKSWLESQLLPGNNLTTYFEVSASEFAAFISANNIHLLRLDYFWQSTAGDQVLPAGTTYLGQFDNGFNIEQWAFSIKQADVSNGSYFVRIMINDWQCGELIALPLVEEEIPEDDDDLPIELPAFNCNETYTPDPLDVTTSLGSAAIGDVFYINGFPILLEWVEGGNGIFSGRGIIPLPFNNSMVRVDFVQAKVNADRVIHDGEVVGLAGNPADYPDFNITPPTLNIGGDICLEAPPPGYDHNGVNEITGLDDYGFDSSTGLHSETQTVYDQNGFDAQGNHESTQSPYNEQGCSREGFTETDQPCDPSGGANPDAENFADELVANGTLSPQVGNTITELSTILENSLGEPELNCDYIREQMDHLVDDVLEFDRRFIFGAEEQYYNPGMHQHFRERPRPLGVNVERDDNVKDLEQLHIELYDCDKARHVANAYLDALEALIGPNQENLEDIVEEILDKIRNWTEYEYNLYHNDSEKFADWLTRELGKMMESLSGLDESYGAIESSEESKLAAARSQLASIFRMDRGRSQPALASLSNSYAFGAEGLSLEDAAFDFLQGEQYIDGVHRAYYLEALARQQLLNGENDGLLPVTVANQPLGGNLTYKIYIDQITFFPTTAALLDAYIIISDAESGQQMVFGAQNISIGPTGFSGESSLSLESTVEIRLNNAAMLILEPEGTFVEWDCDGFAGMHINGGIEFCRNKIVPLDENLQPLADEEQRYRLTFNTSFNHWLDFHLTLNDNDPDQQVPPFAVAGFEDVKWELTNMVIDLSDSYTPNIQVMEGYASPHWSNNVMQGSWKGFYMEALRAYINSDFSITSTPLTIEVGGVLIDGAGFSGEASVSGEDFLKMEEGSLGGWPFSIDGFQVRVLNNYFAGAGLRGAIKVPIIEDAMEYEAVMFPGNEYAFAISPLAESTFPAFLADVTINEDSQIKVGYQNDELLAVAKLSGHIVVNETLTSEIGKQLKLPKLTFENLQVANRAPHINLGEWGVEESGGISGFNFKNFPIKVSKIQPKQVNANTIALELGLDVELVGDGLGINAGGAFEIKALLDEDNYGRQEWVFNSIEIGRLKINASFPGIKRLHGELDWFEDANYGEGFRAIARADFDFIDLGLDAIAHFGKQNEHKYFYIDAAVSLGQGVLATGLINFKGFSGGISYKMDIDQSEIEFPSGGTPNSTDLPLGGSFSQATYTFDPTIGIGLKANAIIASTPDYIFNGTVGLIFEFNVGEEEDSKGLRSIELNGSGQMMADIDFDLPFDYPSDQSFPPT
ncbi:MAG: hypothetical protein AAGA80_15260, partial [Cyanobacteria bacterium P01_F01_bin.143]